jgi:C4-dicarboxylate-specific signal transduction histidine kinase
MRFAWKKIGKNCQAYALFGAAFGFLFPLLATLIRYRAGTSLIALHRGDALLLIIDSAPLVLCLIASAIGYRQDKLQDLHTLLESQQAEALAQEREKSIHLARLATVGEMMSGLAHEIKNPIAVMSLLLEQLESELKSKKFPEELRKSLDIRTKLARQVSRIVAIVDGLRVFARTGELEKQERVTFGELFDAIQTLCAEKLRNNDVKLQMVSGDATLECRIVQVEQVLVNLVGNAIDAVAALPERWVVVACVETDEVTRITVTDSGKGIPPEVAEKIMQPFFTTKGAGKGTGLGLSISRQIIEQHGGRLYLDRSIPRTCFVVELPKAKANSGQKAA